MDGSDTITESLRCWLALHNISGLGPQAVEQLRRHTGSVTAIFELTAAELARTGVTGDPARQILSPDWRLVDRQCDWLLHGDHTLLTWTDVHYPALLREIPDPPLLLFVSGDPGLLCRPQLGIVGSRNPSPVGRECAAEFAARLARLGCVVTSGLATGIDAAAHEGALGQDGLTIAVQGCGPDRIYPRRHRQLAGRIRESGVLVTEFSPGMPPLAANFPRRNRIISGLSLGVLVVEAALRSGSLITARFAVEQGREVFAVPGSIRNPLARGCHALIRQGAKLVETVDDIVEECGPLLAVAKEGIMAPADLRQKDQDPEPEHVALLDAMGDAPVSVDVLVDRSGLTADAVSSMLLLLELRGLVAAQPGGMYSRLR
jgi:DNA processing protein